MYLRLKYLLKPITTFNVDIFVNQSHTLNALIHVWYVSLIVDSERLYLNVHGI